MPPPPLTRRMTMPVQRPMDNTTAPSVPGALQRTRSVAQTSFPAVGSTAPSFTSPDYNTMNVHQQQMGQSSRQTSTVHNSRSSSLHQQPPTVSQFNTGSDDMQPDYNHAPPPPVQDQREVSAPPSARNSESGFATTVEHPPLQREPSTYHSQQSLSHSAFGPTHHSLPTTPTHSQAVTPEEQQPPPPPPPQQQPKPAMRLVLKTGEDSDDGTQPYHRSNSYQDDYSNGSSRHEIKEPLRATSFTQQHQQQQQRTVESEVPPARNTASLIEVYNKPTEEPIGSAPPPPAAPPGKVLVKRRVSKPRTGSMVSSSDGGEQPTETTTGSSFIKPRTLPPPPPPPKQLPPPPPPKPVKEIVVENAALPTVEKVRQKIEEAEQAWAKQKAEDDLAEEKYFAKKPKNDDSASPKAKSVAVAGQQQVQRADGSAGQQQQQPQGGDGGEVSARPTTPLLVKTAVTSLTGTPLPAPSSSSGGYSVTFSAVFGRQVQADRFRRMSLSDRRNVIDAALAQSIFDAVRGPVVALGDVTVSMDIVDDEDEDDNEGRYRGFLSLCGQIDHIPTVADRRLVVRLLTCTFQNPDVFAVAVHPLLANAGATSGPLCSLEQAMINDVEVVGLNSSNNSSPVTKPQPREVASHRDLAAALGSNERSTSSNAVVPTSGTSSSSAEALRQYEQRKRLMSSSYRGYVPMVTPSREPSASVKQYQYHAPITSDRPTPSATAVGLVQARQTPDRYIQQRNIYATTTPSMKADNDSRYTTPAFNNNNTNNNNGLYYNNTDNGVRASDYVRAEELSYGGTPTMSYRTRKYQTI